jgi:hypothetical protein
MVYRLWAGQGSLPVVIVVGQLLVGVALDATNN